MFFTGVLCSTVLPITETTKIPDALHLYQRLPLDLQRVIKSYFYVWHRKGFRREPAVLLPRPELYFTRIRRCPRRLKWNPQYPVYLHYRRQKHFFQWRLRVYTETPTKDLWQIDAVPQWERNHNEGDILEDVFRSRVWDTLNAPIGSEQVEAYRTDYQICISFIVIRHNNTSPPSRQEMAERFRDYVETLSVLFEKIRIP